MGHRDPLEQDRDNVWSVPAGTRLTDAQFESFKAGTLYFNVHSDAYKGGEVRGQIKPYDACTENYSITRSARSSGAAAG